MAEWTEPTRLYRGSASTPQLVNVPPMRFLMLDAAGAREDAAVALITLAYQVKFAARRSIGFAYKVGPLEIVDVDTPRSISRSQPNVGERLMIALPDEIDRDVVDAVKAKAAEKKGLPLIRDVEVRTFSEGQAVQVLELGEHTDMATDLLRRFAAEKKREFSGPRHRIHLNDPARTAPEKLRTIVRYPVRPIR